MPETVMTKAQRLSVRLLHHDHQVTIADVIGDAATYRVNVVRGDVAWAAGDTAANDPPEPAVWCSCPFQGEACSHVLALALKLKEQQ